MNQPPPLPWPVRSAPERIILLTAAALAVGGSIYLLAARFVTGGWWCAWKSGTGWPCAGCGGTRSLLLLAGGDWKEALLLNPGVVFAVAALLAAVLYAAVVLLFRFEPLRPRVPGWRWVVLVALGVNWVYLLVAGRA
jgi:hypothetical protein